MKVARFLMSKISGRTSLKDNAWALWIGRAHV